MLVSRPDMILAGFTIVLAWTWAKMASADRPVPRAIPSYFIIDESEDHSLPLDYRPEFTTNSHKIVHEALRARDRGWEQPGLGEEQPLPRSFIVFIYNWDREFLRKRDMPTTGDIPRRDIERPMVNRRDILVTIGTELAQE